LKVWSDTIVTSYFEKQSRLLQKIIKLNLLYFIGMFYNAVNSSTSVVEQSPHCPKVRDSSPVPAQRFLCKVGHLLLCKQSKRGPELKIFIRALWCHNYTRLKFHIYEFDIWGLWKPVFIQSFGKFKKIFFNNLKTNMLYSIQNKWEMLEKFQSKLIIFIQLWCLKFFIRNSKYKQPR
jgi:hypothetical protein